jgi:predicted nucleotidyltransferase
MNTISIDKIVRKLGLNDKDVLNIYMYGSRLWGYSTDKSDFDIIMIVNHKGYGKRGVHIDDVDATIYDKESFIEELNNNTFLPIVTQIMPVCIIREKLKLKYKFDKDSFIKRVVDEITRDVNFSEKMFNKGKFDNAKKTVIHSLRMVGIAKNILDGSKIIIPSQTELNEMSYEKSLECLIYAKKNLLAD